MLSSLGPSPGLPRWAPSEGSQRRGLAAGGVQGGSTKYEGARAECEGTQTECEGGRTEYEGDRTECEGGRTGREGARAERGECFSTRPKGHSRGFQCHPGTLVPGTVLAESITHPLALAVQLSLLFPLEHGSPRGRVPRARRLARRPSRVEHSTGPKYGPRGAQTPRAQCAPAIPH